MTISTHRVAALSIATMDTDDPIETAPAFRSAVKELPDAIYWSRTTSQRGPLADSIC